MAPLDGTPAFRLPGMAGASAVWAPEGAGQGGSSFADQVMGFDKNGDGRLTPDEVPGDMLQIIRRADRNRDGTADRAELEAMGARSGQSAPAEELRNVGEESASHAEQTPLPTQFDELKALRLGPDGNLVAAEARKKLLQVVAPDGRILSSISPGFKPEAFDFDTEGAIYCGGEGAVAKMDASGRVLRQVKLPEGIESSAPSMRAGSHPPSFSGLAVADDAVYVTYGSGWSVQSKASLVRYSLDLEDPALIETGLSGCCQHCDIIFRDGVLYLAENAAYRVVLFDRDGNRMAKWGSKSRDDVAFFGSCCNPMNLAFDAKGDLYTGESGVGRVKRYSPEGKFLGLVGYLDVERFSRGSGLAAACCYFPVAVTPDGDRVYVSDVKKNVIRVLQRA